MQPLGRRGFAAAMAMGIPGRPALAAAGSGPAPSSGGGTGPAGDEHGGGLTDVAGVRVGHFTDRRRPTGCTAVLVEEGAVCGVDVRGGAPGTRETDALDPLNSVQQAHAILLSGGSAFGLDAAAGVVRYLEERGVGFPVGVGKVPIVPAAILFDLAIGDWKIRPDAAAGYEAARSASTGPVAEGNVGAGAGATVGKLLRLRGGDARRHRQRFREAGQRRHRRGARRRQRARRRRRSRRPAGCWPARGRRAGRGGRSRRCWRGTSPASRSPGRTRRSASSPPTSR